MGRIERFAAVSVLLCLGVAAAADEPLGTYTCYRAVEPIVIDGVLEYAWVDLPQAGLFKNIPDTPGWTPATIALMLWDDQWLYVAVFCEDHDLYATYLNHDDPLWTQDVVEVFIMHQDSTEGHYLEWEVSPRGTTFDTYVTHPSPGLQSILSWTSGFTAATRYAGALDDPGGDMDSVVEMAIPWSDIYDDPSAHPADGAVLRMNLYRIDYDTPAVPGGTGTNARLLAFSPTLCGSFHTPDRFGEVTFLRAVAPDHRLAGDADGDRDVDLDDFVLLKQNFGLTAGAAWNQGDFDHDGAVTLDDFAILKQNFGTDLDRVLAAGTGLP
ncbi:MAG: hypothetical protein GX591_08260 [Planctomycetes bacterium]|nr:hypothetical protein [Planctomycetota bacterium]